MSDKQKIFSGLLRKDLPAGNSDFRSLLTDLAQFHLGKDPVEASGFANVNIRTYWNDLQSILDEQRRRSIHPYFIIPSAGAYAIACSGHELLSAADSESQIIGARLRMRSHLLRQIDSLGHRAYEALAAVLCSNIGSSNVLLTPPGDEGGIDFLAEIVVNRADFLFPAIGTRLRIVGQCKKYTSPLTVDKFEQFLKTLDNVRHMSRRVARHIPLWFQDSNSPIVGWMISHEGFQSGSANEAKQHGVYLSDSVDLAEMLSQASIIDPFKTASQQATVLTDACSALL